MPLLPSRFAVVVTPFFLSIIMTCIISFISTVRGVGLGAGFLQLWFGSWGLSWVIAFPTLLVMLPLVRKATFAVVKMPNEASPN